MSFPYLDDIFIHRRSRKTCFSLLRRHRLRSHRPLSLFLFPALLAAQTTTITIDAAKNRHPISPLIYGVNFGTTRQLEQLNATVNRSGGNGASLFNWQQNARNAGRDWFFESSATNPDVQEQYGDGFVTLTRDAGAKPMLTIPTIGWVARLGPNRSRLASFSTLKYGPQQKFDSTGFVLAGNGMQVDGNPVQDNDPHDAATLDSLEREAAWVAHLVSRWHPAAAGGVPFYLLDNEPSRWHALHRDVHPEGTHAEELAVKTIAYANMVHKADPSARVVAPEETGWLGLRESGFDQQLRETQNTAQPSDRTRETGGMDLYPWLLSRWKQAGHPVDVVSIHFYPQGGEYREGTDDNSPATQLLRNRSTRLLWDPNYLDTSWMHDRIALLPRLRAMIDRYYRPGTPLAITEYNWGGERTLNGATTEADLLGIFGREGVYLATRWIAPVEDSPIFLAMKLFRNYDGHKSKFGDTSVLASAPDPDTVATFAALRSADHALTVIVINKQLQAAAPITLQIADFAAGGELETIQLAGGRLIAAPRNAYRRGMIQTTLPPQSVTLFILHPASGWIY